nr:YjcZ family sporulation protein [Bacillus nakamurai]
MEVKLMSEWGGMGSFALIVVLFILLVIVGSSFFGGY